MDRPETLSDNDFHEAAWLVMGVCDALIVRGGWMSTTELADHTGAGRATILRVCKTLAARGWLLAEDVDNKAMWTLGPELPRVGLSYLSLLNRRAEQLRGQFDAATAPIRSSS